jgi:hypothetical protein
MFAKPNEWVYLWLDGYGWYEDAIYKKRLNKVSRSVSIEMFHANDSCIVGDSSGVVQRQVEGGTCVYD